MAADLRRPPYVAPGHYYSPTTTASDVERAVRAKRRPAGVDLREQEQLDLVRRLQPAEPPRRRWEPHTMFGGLDAAVLRALLLDLRPAHFYEVGSGYSTAVVLDAAEDELPDLRVTCVEPNPERLLSRLRPGDRERLTLVQALVQDVAPEDIAAALAPGDVLFIDSTHVVKAGSDVVWLLLHTLPLLAPGVVVHVHDVHWPFEYEDPWLREGRDWTEAYLLQAFLAHNAAWELLLFNSFLAEEHREALPAALRGAAAGSVWLAVAPADRRARPASRVTRLRPAVRHGAR